MDIVLKIVYMSAIVLIHYYVLTLCFIGLVTYHAVKSDHKTMIRSIIAFCISIAILIGIPMGIMEERFPKETSGNAEAKIIREVKTWMQ